MSDKRFVELDALRGLAAASVVIYHYFFRYNVIYGYRDLEVSWAYWGQFGVELFFMVSGFVIFWTLKRLDKPLDFIVSRFSRLYPAFWVSVAITYTVVLVFGLPGREVPISTALMNLAMFHEYFAVQHVDGVYWTLTVELTFYFWIFVAYMFGFLNRIHALLLIASVMAALDSLGIVSMPNWMMKIFFLKQASFFLAGICFYKISSGESVFDNYLVLWFSFALSAVIYSVSLIPLFFVFYLVFLLAIKGWFPVLKCRPLVFLGLISYSLYLIHQNIGYVVINHLSDNGFSYVFAIFSAAGISVFLAYILYRLVEVKGRLFIRRMYENSRRAQAAATYLSLSRMRP